MTNRRSHGGRASGAPKTLWLYLAGIVPVATLTFALPKYHIVLWGLLGAGSAAAVVTGVVRNRPSRRLPWLLVALALVTFVSGDVTYDVLTDILGRDNPFPSLADAFYLATYPLFGTGLLIMVRSRTREKDSGPLLDALIVTTASALLSWLYLIQPYVRAGDMAMFEKVISVAYPLGDIAIVCVLARLLSAGGHRNTSFNLLALGAGGLLAADVAYGAIQLNGTWAVGGPTDLGWVLFYVCWGAAALHPSMRHLTEPQLAREKTLSRRTVVVLTATTLVAPGLLVWRAVTTGSGDTGIIGAAAAVLFVLVMARLTGVARVQATQASRERALRTTGERLVAATALESVDAAAVEAVQRIVPGVTLCVVTTPGAGGEHVVSGTTPELAGCLLAVHDLGDGTAMRVRHADGTPVAGTGERTRWTSILVPGPAGLRRRVLIGHDGRMPVGSGQVLDALAVQLTLAADRVELAEELHRQEIEARFRSLIQNASDVILVVEASGALRSETPSVLPVLGHRPDEVAAVTLSRLVHPDDAVSAASLIDALLAGRRTGPARAEWRVRHAAGHWLQMEVIANDLSGDIHVGGVVLTMRDVSDRTALEDELRHQAFHDGLTGLANRVLFNDRVDHALRRRSRAGTDVAVLLIDVDDFKFVNDTLGHAAGDELLTQIAGRIVACVRDGDTAARLGGDEFAVCLEFEAGGVDINGVAQRILDATRDAYILDDGSEVSVRVSIGISVAGRQTGGAAEMLREADLALYAAKDGGKDAYHFFESGLHQAVVARLEQRTALEEAIARGDLRLHYQPIVRLSDQTMIGMEALVRWEHPTKGLIPPSEFVPLAEESGLVVPMGRWVLNQACADLARWQREWTPPGVGSLHVSVNISPRQLQSGDFLGVLDSALASHGIDPGSLTLEITESLLVADTLEVMTRLDALRQRGITLALDDFGTGYSSLSYLHRFPIQVLKIDRSFVNGIEHDAERTAILTAIVALARSLGLSLVAEGIEEQSQLDRLRELDCDLGQGYFLGRPMVVEAMDALIAGAAAGASLSARRG